MNEVLKLGVSRIYIRTLTGPDQAKGFQYYPRIPPFFGLKFPGVLNVAFHMRNVPSSLLFVGVTDNVITDLQVHPPKKNRVVVKGETIYELHPHWENSLSIGAELIESEPEDLTWLQGNEKEIISSANPHQVSYYLEQGFKRLPKPEAYLTVGKS